MEQIAIIGGGGTGAAIAHDLVLRGFKVSLFERGELLSGTTGRHHGLLHSGARYAVHDPSAARECIQENKILRQIAPEAIEPNDGLFVALDAADLAYKPEFLDNCGACGIQARELDPGQAIAMEPELNPDLKSAVQVPDATMDAWRLPLHFFATARANGARFHNFSEVVGFYQTKGTVTVSGFLIITTTASTMFRQTCLSMRPGPGQAKLAQWPVSNCPSCRGPA